MSAGERRSLATLPTKQCIGAGLLPLQRPSDHTCSIKQETSGDAAPINGHNTGHTTEEATDTMDLNTDSFITATMD